MFSPEGNIMQCSSKNIGRKLALCSLLAGLALPAALAPADTVWLQSSAQGKPLKLENVKVEGVQDDKLTFTAASGTQTTKTLDKIPIIKLDDEPLFSAAEEAFSKGDWAAAGDNYRKAIAATSRDWVKDRSSMRLVDASDKSGNFADAVAGFVELMKTKPALATQHKPAIPKDHPELLDNAIASVKQEALDQRLSSDQKSVLLNYLLELYTAKGDNAGATAVMQQLGKVMPSDASSPEARRIQADGKLTQARQQISQKQYDQAQQSLLASGNLFTDPIQEADALYLIAQAKSGAARPDDPDQLKDAALAYMRVVANFKGMEGQPHVADSLFSTAQIEEKLKNPKEAIALYNQVATEFKNSPLAGAAQQNAARLAAAPKG
jgi:TolA-binding protein